MSGVASGASSGAACAETSTTADLYLELRFGEQTVPVYIGDKQLRHSESVSTVMVGPLLLTNVPASNTKPASSGQLDTHLAQWLKGLIEHGQVQGLDGDWESTLSTLQNRWQYWRDCSKLEDVPSPNGLSSGAKLVLVCLSPWLQLSVDSANLSYSTTKDAYCVEVNAKRSTTMNGMRGNDLLTKSIGCLWDYCMRPREFDTAKLPLTVFTPLAKVYYRAQGLDWRQHGFVEVVEGKERESGDQRKLKALFQCLRHFGAFDITAYRDLEVKSIDEKGVNKRYVLSFAASGQDRKRAIILAFPSDNAFVLFNLFTSDHGRDQKEYNEGKTWLDYTLTQLLEEGKIVPV